MIPKNTLKLVTAAFLAVLKEATGMNKWAATMCPISIGSSTLGSAGSGDAGDFSPLSAGKVLVRGSVVSWLPLPYAVRLLLVILVGCAACGPTQKGPMTMPTLPKLELPDKTLLLYEQITVNNPDRTENWRFFLRKDGCFFNARNTQLWVTDSVLLSNDNPKLFWNKPFSATPDRCLTESQQAELVDAIHKANFSSLDKYYTTPSRVSDPSVVRWTVVEESGTYTVVVESGATPQQLVQLRSAIDKLIANAPQSKSP